MIIFEDPQFISAVSLFITYGGIAFLLWGASRLAKSIFGSATFTRRGNVEVDLTDLHTLTRENRLMVTELRKMFSEVLEAVVVEDSEELSKKATEEEAK